MTDIAKLKPNERKQTNNTSFEWLEIVVYGNYWKLNGNGVMFNPNAKAMPLQFVTILPHRSSMCVRITIVSKVNRKKIKVVQTVNRKNLGYSKQWIKII